MKNLKIKISINAYNDLINLLKFHNEYDCIKLSYKEGCCKSSNIDITLDNKKLEDTCEVIDNLNIVYDKLLLEKVSEIMIMIKNGNFVAKSNSINVKNKEKNCSCSCNSREGHCGGCKKLI